MVNHSEAPYPHEGACIECRTDRTCNFCGAKAPAYQRCTNGRCVQCHRTVCTGGGASDPGHAFGQVGGPWRSSDAPCRTCTLPLREHRLGYAAARCEFTKQ